MKYGDDMNNPKIYLAVFAVSCLVLFGLIKLFPSKQAENFKSVVLAQTLTQSLDGHRRYIQIETEAPDALLVQIDPLIDCPQGSTVEVSKQSNLLSDTYTYKLVKCYLPPIE